MHTECLVSMPEGKRSLGGPTRRTKRITQLRWEGVGMICLVLDIPQWRVPLNTELKPVSTRGR
jgi:hypothetical protein